MPTFTPITVDGLITLIETRLQSIEGRAAVALDGADAAHPGELADRLAASVRNIGRPASVVSVHDFVRPASVRLEYGHTDETSYRSAWFDYAALQREVIDGLRLHGRWLPRLWDEHTDRSPRAAALDAGGTDVVIVAGPMLRGRGLGFDLTVRLDMSEAALRRATEPEQLWTVPALLRHERDAEPADIVVRWDHPQRPAVQR
ncbi:hypothetical protein OG921_19300 [Aldersonia sp. NBC_00410]|uniref:hypothetical protein n=1 Tax=Aldersonia sp. NBC_00410 TaxID=2975954 RepID=UPI002253AE44|nr:hypothetical protein [Aldersonia sp. NBC_00410]MCX5045316.1 hypothetical protein [Aldersonia sp. NBC_00410]